MAKTYVEIYNMIDFIKQNHSKLFPTEIMDRINISPQMLKKVTDELGLELFNISRADNVIERSKRDTPKRKYTRKKKSLVKRIFDYMKKI